MTPVGHEFGNSSTLMSHRRSRRHRFGAELTAGGVEFRVWAPGHDRIDLVIDPEMERVDSGRAIPMEPAGAGWFELHVDRAAPGDLYGFRLPHSGRILPDPASRFQPSGVHGPSQVTDPASFDWRSREWRGPDPNGNVLYELHIGTFSPEGTWEGARAFLPALRELGITVLEVMPVAEFAGGFGWGYDGVDLWAPTHLYGTPDELRGFVDDAHRLGLAVILDVVYNHIGPEGNYLEHFTRSWFTDRYRNEWGEAMNFDGPGSREVREFFVSNAVHWLDEYRIDGLRFDATHSMFDQSREHIVSEMERTLRARFAGRTLLLIAENEPQESRIVRPREEGGWGFDGIWNDDFHHSAIVALTGRNDAYYSDYYGKPQELISAAKRGFLYQGQHYSWQKKRRGTPTSGVPAHAFIGYLENHDQVANSARGSRLASLAAPAELRAMMSLLLLGPWTPMLFQGEELGSETPFLYFADHEPELARRVREGRGEFLQQFRAVSASDVQQILPDPGDRTTFERCRFVRNDDESSRQTWQLIRDLLRLRRDDLAFASREPGRIDGAVLADEAFVLRFFQPDGRDRLLIVNLGRDLRFDPAPEPLLAPVEGGRWSLLWSSEHPDYGGSGVEAPDPDGPWTIPGNAAMVLA